MTVTDEDKAAVRRALEALRELNAAIDVCSDRRIVIGFSDTIGTLGKLNNTFVCTRMERVTVERILP
jgi:hypothetical protein